MEANTKGMNEPIRQRPEPSHGAEPEYYAVRVNGHLDARWSEWFEGLTVTAVEGGETTLSGPVADQGALHGLFSKVRDLNLALISVNRIEPGQLRGGEDDNAE